MGQKVIEKIVIRQHGPVLQVHVPGAQAAIVGEVEIAAVVRVQQEEVLQPVGPHPGQLLRRHGRGRGGLCPVAAGGQAQQQGGQGKQGEQVGAFHLVGLLSAYPKSKYRLV